MIVRTLRRALAALALAWALEPALPAVAEEILVQSGQDAAPYSFLPSLARGARETAYSFTGDDEIGLSHNFNSFIRFDLPPDLIPPGEEVVEAVAWVTYGFDFTGFGEIEPIPGLIECRPVFDAWEERTLTWINQPAYGEPVDVQTGIESLRLIWCDVTELVRDWVTGALPNHGIVLTNPTERLIGMYSFESDDVHPNLRPSLAIRTAPSGLDDLDSDGVADAVDNCPLTPNALQDDADGDGVGDFCDVCPAIHDPVQADADGDGRGDRCSAGAADLDGNGWVDGADVEVLLAAVGTASGEPGFDPSADLDGDGAVTDGDMWLWLPLYMEFSSRAACGLLGVEPLVAAVALAARRRRRSRA